MSSMQREYATELGLAVFYSTKGFVEAIGEYASIYDVSFVEAKDVVRREYHKACRGKARLTSQTGIFERV